MADHTAGPWRTAVLPGEEVRIVGNDGTEIAQLSYLNGPEAADARLIAAAPALLAACEEAYDAFEHIDSGRVEGDGSATDPMLGVLRAALAQARE